MNLFVYLSAYIGFYHNAYKRLLFSSVTMSQTDFSFSHEQFDYADSSLITLPKHDSSYVSLLHQSYKKTLFSNDLLLVDVTMESDDIAVADEQTKNAPVFNEWANAGIRHYKTRLFNVMDLSGPMDLLNVTEFGGEREII